jgi:hypothetical protein
MKTEKQLINYLTMDAEVREKEEREHWEYIDAQIFEQEQEEEQAAVSATVESE